MNDQRQWQLPVSQGGVILWDTSVQQLWGKISHICHQAFYLAVYGVWEDNCVLALPLPSLPSYYSLYLHPPLSSFPLCSTILSPLRFLFFPLLTRKGHWSRGENKCYGGSCSPDAWQKRKDLILRVKAVHKESTSGQLTEWWQAILSYMTKVFGSIPSLRKDFIPYFH